MTRPILALILSVLLFGAAAKVYHANLSAVPVLAEPTDSGIDTRDDSGKARESTTKHALRGAQSISEGKVGILSARSGRFDSGPSDTIFGPVVELNGVVREAAR